MSSRFTNRSKHITKKSHFNSAAAAANNNAGLNKVYFDEDANVSFVGD
jgi:hypothetical protein